MSFFSNRDPKIELIRKVPVFAASSKKELEQLASRMDEITVPAGTSLIREGHSNHAFYILVEGAAEARRDRKSLATFASGDYFGEISMMDHEPATATVVTTAESTLLTMGHAQFRDAVRSDAQIDSQVAETRSARLRSNAETGLTTR